MMKPPYALPLVLFLGLLTACTTQTTSNKSANIDSSRVITSVNSRNAAASRVKAAKEYIRRNNLERAKYHLDKASKHDSSYPDLYYALGFYYQMANEKLLAKESFRKAIYLDGKNPEFKNGYGQFLCAIEEYEDAQKYLQEAIDTPTYSNVAEAFFNAGVCKIKEKDMDGAKLFFRKALKINARLPGPLLELSNIEYNENQFQRAKFYYTQLLKNTNIQSPRFLWLGLRIEHKLGNKDVASSYALQLEQLFPNSEETKAYTASKDQWQ